MTISYNREVDALYIEIIETRVSTKHEAEGIAVDFAMAGSQGSKFSTPASAPATLKSSGGWSWRMWRSQGWRFSDSPLPERRTKLGTYRAAFRIGRWHPEELW
ncbi:MAG TPA: DUF2283 domain-containing protein [Terriglobia bacterium]|jgi:hypothetical protein|nr:DUF2283 domain-containing protein [Terriglobia bacterium]